MKGSVCLCRRTLPPNTDADAALASQRLTRAAAKTFERALLIAAVLICDDHGTRRCTTGG